jgi:hypothetical protein
VRHFAPASPRQGPDTNSPRFDHNQIAQEFISVVGSDLDDHISFRGIRKAIQLQQDHAPDPQPLTDDQFAEIAILRDQDAALGVRRLKDVLVRRARSRYADR